YGFQNASAASSNRCSQGSHYEIFDPTTPNKMSLEVVDNADEMVVTGSFSGAVCVGDQLETAQSDEDMLVAKRNADLTFAWSLAFSASTAFSVAHPEAADTFGVGTATRGRSITHLSDEVIAVAGDFTFGDVQRCFVAKFRGENQPPSVEIFEFTGQCTAG